MAFQYSLFSYYYCAIFMSSLQVEYVSLDDLLGQSDFVSVHCPFTPETQNLFNKDTFAKMKKSAIFINTSRGKVVDQDALYDVSPALCVFIYFILICCRRL